MKRLITLASLVFALNTAQATDIAGSITTDQTLTLAGSPYLLTGDVIVEKGATLTIEPGVEVDLYNSNYDLIIKGRLLANGTPSGRIYFWGNSSVGEGAVAFLKGEENSSITYATFLRMGGSYAFNAALYIDSTTVYLANTNLYENNQDIRASANSIGGFQSSNNLSTIVIFEGTLTDTTTWGNVSPYPFYYEIEDDIVVPEGTQLTLAPNINLYFKDYTHDLLVEGTLIANGTSAEPIQISGGAPIGGGSIVFFPSSQNSSIEYCSIGSMGINSLANYDCAIKVETASIRIAKSTIQNNIRGIWVDHSDIFGEKRAAIFNNLIQGNATGVAVSNGDPIVHFNSIIDNTFGLSNPASNTPIDACNNWWGDSTGPYNAVLNPSGQGDPVSDNVNATGCFLENPPAIHEVNLRVFLEGAFLGNDAMNTTLSDLALLPLLQPYSGPPWNYTGTEEITGMEVGVTDWVLLSIRTNPSNTSTLYEAATLLLEDGKVVSTTGRTLFFNLDAPQDSLYIAIYHRNHVGMMTATSVPKENDTFSYDFTQDNNPIAGGNLGRKELSGGSFGMIAGDFDSNGQVQNIDYNMLLLTLGLAGYLSGDLNLNSQVQNTDVQNLASPNLGRGASFSY